MQKSVIIRIEGNDYIWSLEKVTNQCYLLMSSVKKTAPQISHIVEQYFKL